MATRKIKLRKSVIVEGLGHCNAGEILEVGESTARNLVGMNLADTHVPAGEDAPNDPKTLVIPSQMQNEPPAKRVAAAPKTAKRAKDDQNSEDGENASDKAKQAKS